MTSDEFDRMVVQGGVKLMLENDRKCLERGGMILAKEFEGELWIKAAHHNQAVKQAVEAEREACAKLCEEAHWSLDDRNEYAAAIRARGQE
jgi:hypothetical protein